MLDLPLKLWRDEAGQDIAEYAVMLAVILVLVVGTVRLVGNNANNAFSSVEARSNNSVTPNKSRVAPRDNNSSFLLRPARITRGFFVLCRYRARQTASRQQRKRPSGCLRTEDVFPRDNSRA